MKKSLILKAILFTTAILLLIAPITVFADEEITAIPHSEHVDNTGDALCDIEDCDACISHVDEDANGVCDREGCGFCMSHVDEDNNKVCDRESCKEKTTSSTFGTDEWLKNVLESLKMMGLGMIGIFLVIGLIIIVIYVLNRLINMTEKKQNKKE